MFHFAECNWTTKENSYSAKQLVRRAILLAAERRLFYRVHVILKH